MFISCKITSFKWHEKHAHLRKHKSLCWHILCAPFGSILFLLRMEDILFSHRFSLSHIQDVILFFRFEMLIRNYVWKRDFRTLWSAYTLFTIVHRSKISIRIEIVVTKHVHKNQPKMLEGLFVILISAGFSFYHVCVCAAMCASLILNFYRFDDTRLHANDICITKFKCVMKWKFITENSRRTYA